MLRLGCRIGAHNPAMSARRILVAACLLLTVAGATAQGEVPQWKAEAIQKSLGGKKAVYDAYASLTGNPAYRSDFPDLWYGLIHGWRAPSRYEAALALFRVDRLDREAMDRIKEGQSTAEKERLRERRQAISSELLLLKEFAVEWCGMSGDKSTQPFENRIRDRERELGTLDAISMNEEVVFATVKSDHSISQKAAGALQRGGIECKVFGGRVHGLSVRRKDITRATEILRQDAKKEGYVVDFAPVGL